MKCKVKNCKLIQRNKTGIHAGYCNKHRCQLRKYGKILSRTIFDSNKYILCKNYIKIYLYKKNKIISFSIIDKEDFEKVKTHKWVLNGDNYVINSKNKLLLHHLILGKPIKGKEIDHINHNPLDNRKNNLRFVNRSQNNMNRLVSPYNKSGKIGVSWFNSIKKWRVYSSVNNKQVNLGYFKSKRKAIKARINYENNYKFN
jgi:hypothetical protein